MSLNEFKQPFPKLPSASMWFQAPFRLIQGYDAMYIANMYMQYGDQWDLICVWFPQYYVSQIQQFCWSLPTDLHILADVASSQN